MMPEQTAIPTITHGDFARAAAKVDSNAAVPRRIETLMLNVGLQCDLSCEHCHHACSPARVEVMSRDTLHAALRFAERLHPSLIDVTGGEPALYPHLRELLELAGEARIPLRIRTNLVALARPEAADLPVLMALSGTHVLGSLPGSSAAEVTGHRASSVWETSIEVLQRLASLGYGAGAGLELDLAHNPPFGELPRPQDALEAEFRVALEPLGVRFDRLLSISNVPVGRLDKRLRADARADAYAALLRDAFNPAAVPELECRRSIEVAWDGTMWDCDFNLAAGLPPAAGPLSLDDLADDLAPLSARRIAFGPHCFACTAGAGSG